MNDNRFYQMLNVYMRRTAHHRTESFKDYIAALLCAACIALPFALYFYLMRP